MFKMKKTMTLCASLAVVALAGCSAAPASVAPTPSAASPSASGAAKTISLSVMTSDRFLELAKQKYEAAHPGTTVQIKEYVAAPTVDTKAPSAPDGKQQNMVMVAKPDPKNAEKYVTSVGAELMSGKASDIIVMDGLPYRKYADKKLLENLSDWMGKDSSFKKDDYYSGMLNAMAYKGSLYTIPAKIGLTMWLGNQSVLGSTPPDDSKWTWADFKKQAAAWQADKNNDGKPDVYPLGKVEPDQLVTQMLNSSFAKFVDAGAQKAKFDSPDFIQLLKLAKSMYDDQIIVPDTADANNVVFQPKSNIMMYMDMYALPKMQFGGKGAFYNLPSENDVKGTLFTSSLPLAINSKSTNKQEAWDFVKFLLSDDMQSARELNGFAVNKNGAKAQLDTLKTLGTGNAKMKLNINGNAMTLQAATDEEVATITGVLDKANVYAESDAKISTIVAEETVPFFQGQKSAEEVAKIIQNKVSTYLQE
ncbi:ABC transporter substrate-binding protein [Paenibacillus ferrarius]|uniref:ABC transporter substrate-binding protein n=1 Tax=Paenibacillus ferrarius TaxID=1469647 RepID=UPI003D2CF4D3